MSQMSVGNADDSLNATELKVRPSSCVALHRGQLCFQTLSFSWINTREGREYCLYLDHMRLNRLKRFY